MSSNSIDIAIVGAGPVGLMCAYLAERCGLTTAIVDKTSGPLKVGRADALNARTLQLLEVAGLFGELYSLGKPCNTSSVWANGEFVSRQSGWWDQLEGCLHKHFLMLGQSHLEKLLDEKLNRLGAGVIRSTTAENIWVENDECSMKLSNGKTLISKFIIAADGSRSFVRDHLGIGFEITRPEIIWAVIDGIVETDFKKVPEIIVFQAETSDVAWIPREGTLDRFYVRMDTKEFTQGEVIAKINRALHPCVLKFKEIDWFSHFSVKESVADKFRSHDRIFLVGDACHIHSVNGGQGLNTGLADAFNLVWKLKNVLSNGAALVSLESYESERKPVALSVVKTSAALVRSTKFSDQGTHAKNYVKIVEANSGNITGMGIRYEGAGLSGTRLFDFEVFDGELSTRLYSLLDYAHFTLFIFGEVPVGMRPQKNVKVVQIFPDNRSVGFWTLSREYSRLAVLVRPDAYIQCVETVRTL